MADSVFVLQPDVRPVPLRLESGVQDIGPPEISQFHIISNGESSPRDLHLNANTQLHSMSQQATLLDTSCQTTSKTGTQLHRLAERLPKIIIRSQTPQNTTRRDPAHQKDKIQPHPPEHRHLSPPAGSLRNPLTNLSHWGQTPKTIGTTNMQPA